MIRIDVLFNKTLHPFIAEANMSPGITPTIPETEYMAPIYEQVIYSTAKLVGAGSKADLMSG